MEAHYYLRSTSQYTWGYGICFLAAAAIFAQVVQNGTKGLLATCVIGVGLLLFAAGVYFLPVCEVSPSGVRIRNFIMTTWIPFEEMEDVQTRWGMMIHTRHGKKYPVQVFGNSGYSRWATSHIARDHGGIDKYETGQPIPVLQEGELRVRATTLTASRLIEEFHAMYRSAEKGRVEQSAFSPHNATSSDKAHGSGVTRSLSWVSVILTLAGSAVIVGALYVLFA